ncbi:flagellar hook assembly protein FlgD [Paucisalibacillus globulus]|jgi:flagellar basal-body rod modification protein FlgD|uniref:flagellar hook assembly protein FlgD n=1 Tax=Paucisalibacillus globulus TaxID=351095 RepID=UPI000BB68C8A|nr:flagellar hook assembly protein FlgD [Paucisalibacillus globulus]
MTTIDPSLYLKNQTKTRVPSNELGKDDFLKILMTQIQHQDPTNPMEDREFISQLAQFSSLEQVMNMSTAINNLVSNQQLNPIIQYSHMIGKTVSYQTMDEETGELSEVLSSEVVSVSQRNGYAVLELTNGDSVYADLILEARASEKKTEEDSNDNQN